MEGSEELEGVPQPGEIVAGKYRVDRVLGVGGMGCVIAATHTTLDQQVAIKFLLNKAAKNPKNITRFQREAKAAARIRSDHVAKVSDFGALDDGTPFMVMEFLEGEDMADRVQHNGPLPVDHAVCYLLQAMEALAEAHAAGIVHRDLKPANIFMSTLPSGQIRVKVLDFGISKIQLEPGQGDDLTRTSALMGSPLYMSPEQMMSAKAADGRADIWALGVILFELITGQPPFIGATLPEICSKILTAPPTPLTQLLPSAPPQLVAVVEGALAKKPEERYQSLAHLAMALAPFGGSQAHRSAEIVCRMLPGAAAVSQQQPQAVPPTVPTGAPTPSHMQPPPIAVTPLPVATTGGTSTPGSISHGAVSAGAVSGGAVSGGAVSGGAVSGGAVSGGAVSGGAVSGGAVSGGAVSAGAVSAATMAAASATGAPVANTWNEEPKKKSRTGLVVGLAALLFGAIGVAAVVGFSGGDDQDEAAPAAEAPAEEQATETGETSAPADKAVAETEPPTKAQPKTQPKTPDSAEPAKIAETPPKPRRPGRRLKQKIKNQVKKTRPNRGHKAKPDDDLFN